MQAGVRPRPVPAPTSSLDFDKFDAIEGIQKTVPPPIEELEDKEEKTDGRKFRYITIKRACHIEQGCPIQTPAGPCPVEPRMKNPTDEEVVEWAIAVFEEGDRMGYSYTPSAVKYFSKRYWGDNKRISNLIHEAIAPRVSGYETQN
jgi:hypothetical protein